MPLFRGLYLSAGYARVNNAMIAGSGVDIVTNGAFAADTDWTKDTDWTIAAGVATKAAGAAARNITQTLSTALVGGGVYQCQWTVTAYAAGTLRPLLTGAGQTNGDAATATGTYVTNMLALAGQTQLAVRGTTGATDGSIDNVSLRRVS